MSERDRHPGRYVSRQGARNIGPDKAAVALPELQFDDENVQNLANQMKAFTDKGMGLGQDPNERYVRVSDLVEAGIVTVVNGKIMAGDAFSKT